MTPAHRLLVVDDSLTVRKLVELSFRSGHWQIEFAGSGGEALAKVRLLRPDLVLLDYVLPDMKGTDFCKLLAADATLAGVPIVVMSAKQASLREKFREFPAVVSFLQKPFSVDAITTHLGAVLEKRQLAAGALSSSVADPHVADPHGPPEGSFSHAQKEAAAKALYGRLAPQFGRIPEWMVGLGGANPATFFGKKILSSAVMDQLLAVLLPICRDIAASSGTGRSVDEATEMVLDTIFERGSDFSRKVQSADLSASDRQLLSLVDGRRTIANIVHQTTMKASHALALLRRLEELSLVRHAALAEGQGQARTAAKVVIFEPDARSFRRQLDRLLRERADPLEMIAVNQAEDVVSAVAHEPPRLVLLNATAAGEKSASLAAAARRASRGAETKIAAILEMPSSAQGRELSVAGCDAVLVKPIPYTDIDALLLVTGGVS